MISAAASCYSLGYLQKFSTEIAHNSTAFHSLKTLYFTTLYFPPFCCLLLTALYQFFSCALFLSTNNQLPPKQKKEKKKYWKRQKLLFCNYQYKRQVLNKKWFKNCCFVVINAGISNVYVYMYMYICMRAYVRQCV